MGKTPQRRSQRVTPMTDAPVPLPLSFRAVSTARGILRGPAGVLAAPFVPLLRRILNWNAPGGHTLVTVSGGENAGARMYVDLACEKYYWLGTHEEDTQRLLAQVVCPGWVAYDVGAHVGFFSLLLSRLATASGSVHAFEPRPENVDRLQANVRANHVRNVEIHPVAAADRAGEAAFVLTSSTLQGHIAEDGVSSAAHVRTDTIDAMVRDGMPPPHIVKVDVEGTEGSVLRGAVRTIDLHRPLLLLEVHSADAGRDVIDALPCTYAFESLDGRRAEPPLDAGHYLARPIEHKEED